MQLSSLTRSFLWVAVLSWGVGLGAKLFDLLVLTGAWEAEPPASLAFYPYGRSWPINPGSFFQPLSVLILIGTLGALASGWKTTFAYRLWLSVPLAALVVIWVTTPTIFWPMINSLYQIAHGRVSSSDADVIKLVRRWVFYDWLRVALIALGFVASIQVISMPYPSRNLRPNPSTE